MITIQKVCVTAAVSLQQTVRGISKQNVICAASQLAATIREP